MKFSDIPGHDDIKARLRDLVDGGRLPHALLLQGPEGTAKFALARATAQYIHCAERTGGDSCGRCPSCRQMQSFNHIDTIFTFPVIKKAGRPAFSNDYMKEFAEYVDRHPWMDFDAWLEALGSPNTLPRIYVDEGVELIRRLSFTSHASRYKVALLWQPERMNEDTANKLLKLVEEPYPDTVFIMTSDIPRAILPTIYSRVQRIDVPRYEPSVMVPWLMERGARDPEHALETARLSEGNLNRALRMIEAGTENEDFFNAFVDLMRKAYQRDIAALRGWSAQLAAEKRERQLRFLDYCCRMLRENFIYNMHRPDLSLLGDKERQFSSRFARFITEGNVVGLTDTFTAARNDIALNANSRIVFFDVAVTVILLLKQ